MAFFQLQPADLRTGAGFGKYSSETDRWRMTYTVNLKYGDTLQLKTGEPLEQLLIYANLSRSTEERITWLRNRGEGWEEAYGSLHYFPARADDLDPTPPTVIFEAYIPAEDLAQLLRCALSGKHPSSIDYEAPSVGYDWKPDGSGKVWDNVTAKIVPINEVRFGIPLLVAPEPYEPTSSGRAIGKVWGWLER